MRARCASNEVVALAIEAGPSAPQTVQTARSETPVACWQDLTGGRFKRLAQNGRRRLRKVRRVHELAQQDGFYWERCRLIMRGSRRVTHVDATRLEVSGPAGPVGRFEEPRQKCHIMRQCCECPAQQSLGRQPKTGVRTQEAQKILRLRREQAAQIEQGTLCSRQPQQGCSSWCTEGGRHWNAVHCWWARTQYRHN